MSFPQLCGLCVPCESSSFLCGSSAHPRTLRPSAELLRRRCTIWTRSEFRVPEVVSVPIEVLAKESRTYAHATSATECTGQSSPSQSSTVEFSNDPPILLSHHHKPASPPIRRTDQASPSVSCASLPLVRTESLYFCPLFLSLPSLFSPQQNLRDPWSVFARLLARSLVRSLALRRNICTCSSLPSRRRQQQRAMLVVVVFAERGSFHSSFPLSIKCHSSCAFSPSLSPFRSIFLLFPLLSR